MDFKNELPLQDLYDAIQILLQLLSQDLNDPVLLRPDYRKVKALAACYELNDYLAGELPPDIEG